VTAIALARGIHVALFQRQDVGDPAAPLRDLVESVAWPPELVGRAALRTGGRSGPGGVTALRPGARHSQPRCAAFSPASKRLVAPSAP